MKNERSPTVGSARLDGGFTCEQHQDSSGTTGCSTLALASKASHPHRADLASHRLSVPGYPAAIPTDYLLQPTLLEPAASGSGAGVGGARELREPLLRWNTSRGDVEHTDLHRSSGRLELTSGIRVCASRESSVSGAWDRPDAPDYAYAHHARGRSARLEEHDATSGVRRCTLGTFQSRYTEGRCSSPAAHGGSYRHLRLAMDAIHDAGLARGALFGRRDDPGGSQDRWRFQMARVLVCGLSASLELRYRRRATRHALCAAHLRYPLRRNRGRTGVRYDQS